MLLSERKKVYQRIPWRTDSLFGSGCVGREKSLQYAKRDYVYKEGVERTEAKS